MAQSRLYATQHIRQVVRKTVVTYGTAKHSAMQGIRQFQPASRTHDMTRQTVRCHPLKQVVPGSRRRTRHLETRARIALNLVQAILTDISYDGFTVNDFAIPQGSQSFMTTFA
jgi:hypothetical protein